MCQMLNLFIPVSNPVLPAPVRTLAFSTGSEIQRDFRARYAKGGTIVAGGQCLCGLEDWDAVFEIARASPRLRRRSVEPHERRIFAACIAGERADLAWIGRAEAIHVHGDSIVSRTRGHTLANQLLAASHVSDAELATLDVPQVAVRVVTRPTPPTTEAASPSELAFDLRRGDVLIIASPAVHTRPSSSSSSRSKTPRRMPMPCWISRSRAATSRRLR